MTFRTVMVSLNREETELWNCFENMLEDIFKEINGDGDSKEIKHLCDIILTHMYDLTKFINKG